jgi:hypothetical protein
MLKGSLGAVSSPQARSARRSNGRARRDRIPARGGKS